MDKVGEKDGEGELEGEIKGGRESYIRSNCGGSGNQDPQG
jgi:hypothetical protein